ncbi:MAG: Tad domain-containing protein [Selenomonadaceae bacterium]|nr:Tad domain-containing protein [Selenomonadaceae bacterium]
MKKFLKFLKFLSAQKGQTLVLYALLVPLLFMVGGASVDLGWYYYNNARLQNMADAAVIAGGKALVSENGELTNYTYNKFLSEVPREERDDKYNLQTPIGDAEAKNYIVKNLSENSNWNGNQINDNFSNSELNFQRNIYGIKDNQDIPLYYEVELTEKHQHLFDILNDPEYSLGNTVITVNSVAELKYSPPPEDPTPPPQETAPEPISNNIPRLAAVSVVSGNWELEDGRISGKWKKANAEKELAKNTDNLFIQMSVNSIYPVDKVWLNYNSTTNSYTTGNFYRSATVYVNPGNGRLRTGNDSTKGEKYPDSITLGFRQDLIRVLPGYLEIQDGKVVRVKDGGDTIFDQDWDIRRNTPYNRKTEVRYINPNKFWDKSCDLRIHNIFNFDTPFEVRPEVIEADKSNPYDALWVRVESEAFIPLKMLGVNKANHVQYKSVRQIILNMNGDNTVKDENGNYKYRPVVMFYMGPEKIDMSSSVRNSKPIILNLNADFRGILFAPYSPVILNANGHKFYGFIVAKEYRKFTVNKNEGHKVKHNKSNEMYIDDYGEVFSERTDIEKCGDYDSFNIMSFEDYGYQVADEEASQNNLLIYSE